MIDSDYMILRLYVLRIGNGQKDCKYKIAYGIATPFVSGMTEPVISQFTKLGSFGKKCSLAAILIALETDVIVSIYNDLLEGISFKLSLAKWNVDTSKMSYDVVYSQKYVNIPWFEDNVASYQINYTRVAWMLEPLQLFDVEGIDPDKKDDVLAVLTSAVSKKTHFPENIIQEKIGNLDIIVAPARNENWKMLVESSLTKGTPFVLRVNVLSELSDKYESIFVNARITVGGKVIADQLKNIKTEQGITSSLSFESQYPPETTEIKVWGFKDNASILIHKATYHYIQQILINTEICGERINVDTVWLEKLRKMPMKSKKQLWKRPG